MYLDESFIVLWCGDRYFDKLIDFWTTNLVDLQADISIGADRSRLDQQGTTYLNGLHSLGYLRRHTD